MVAYGRCQIANIHIDSLDTIVKGDVSYVYYRTHEVRVSTETIQIVERLHYIGDKIDVTVVYIYRDGVLVRREWWKGAKVISYTLEN